MRKKRKVGQRPTLRVFSAGIAAFVNGLKSVFNQNERRVLVYASKIIGAPFTFFTLLNACFLLRLKINPGH